MNRQLLSRLCFFVMLAAGGAIVSAQVLLPSAPPKQFGGSVTPAFEGWYDNADGTHTFLIGYFSRNTQAELDVPIGPNNHFEPGEADLGQPTHFLPSRHYGMFTFTLPKEFGRTQKVSWTLTVNGVTTTVPFYMGADYNVSPFKSSEQSPGGGYNLPPVIRFLENGTTFAAPAATLARAFTRTTTFGTPLALDIWADDDAKYSSGTNAPVNGSRPPVTLSVSQYRGPGKITFGDAHPKLDTIKGGKPDEPYSGKASTLVNFSEAGDYLLHVTANDYSGNGGGGSVCCWTTAVVRVDVKPPANSTTGQ